MWNQIKPFAWFSLSIIPSHHHAQNCISALFLLSLFILTTNVPKLATFQLPTHSLSLTTNDQNINSSPLTQEQVPAPKPVKILVHPKNATVIDKKIAVLICEVESDPKPIFNWFKDGKPLNKKRLPIIKYNRGTILRIEPLKSERDSGEYECQVENGAGSATRSQIQVRGINETDTPVGFPRFVTQPSLKQLVQVGIVITIPCQAIAQPAPDYLWLYESVPIQMNNRFRLENGGSLRISNVTESDKGEYMCIASNEKGLITTISEITVIAEPLPEGAPTDLKYKLTSPNDVTFTWLAPKTNVTVTGYAVYFGVLGASSSIRQEIGLMNRFAFNDLSENTKYAFRVRAISKGGHGVYSETITFSTPKDSPPPPANVKAFADSYTSAMIWWDETAYFSGIIGYKVYYTLYNKTPSSESNTLQMNIDLDKWLTKNVTLTNSVVISNLIESSEYEVRVCAIGSDFLGKLSSSVKFIAQPNEVPYDLKILDLTTHSAKITWKPPLVLNPPNYKIAYDAPEKYFLDDTGNKQLVSIPTRVLYTSASNQVVIDDLRPFTKYRINVTAIPQKEAFRPPATVHITTAMAAPKPMVEPSLVGISSKGTEFEVLLPWASEEYGQIGTYYIIVVPSDMPSHDPDSYSITELVAAGPNSGPYVAAKFSRLRMVKRFLLGDNKSYDGFVNRPLARDQQYYVFVRAVVENSDSLYTSSPMSAAISLSLTLKSAELPFKMPNDSFKQVRWILVSALVLVLILALIVTVFYKKQRKALKTNQINETTISLLPDQIYSSVPIEPVDRRYQSRAMLNHPPVPVQDLANHIEALSLNNNLKDEYESIEPGQQFTWEHSYMDYNRPKNRYGNVVAYDHSRVVLSRLDGLPGSDYINANFCDGYNKPNHYIATQGPLPNTVGDFWRMVWEQKSRTLVMMTQLEERGRVKCVQYWPSRDSVTYHGIVVIAGEVEELAYYNIRTFRLQHNNEIREIRQFQFTAWPDHGVPDHPTPFLMFLRRIKVSNPPGAGPMIVLCSAGVGRTGCFIVIDSMIERMKQENTIDIYGHVTSLRAQRNYIVQTEDQYMFIHDAVLEAIIAFNTEVPVSKLTEHIQKLMQVSPTEGSSGLELEFKRLASVKYSTQKFISANLPINKHKNRLMTILPYETTRVCLEPIAGVEGSDYINASFCDGYRQRNAYIATQSPMPNTVEDMWRMLIEHNSSIIVMLTKLKEMGREKCTQYWPAERYGDYGPYRIALEQECDTTSNYIYREFRITDSRSPNYSRVIRQFQYLNWPELVSF